MKNIVKLRKKLDKTERLSGWLTDHWGLGPSVLVGMGFGAVVTIIVAAALACPVGWIFAAAVPGALLGVIPGAYVFPFIGLGIMNIADRKCYKLRKSIIELEKLIKNCDINNPDEVALYQRVEQLKEQQKQIELAREELKKNETKFNEDKKLVVKLYQAKKENDTKTLDAKHENYEQILNEIDISKTDLNNGNNTFINN